MAEVIALSLQRRKRYTLSTPHFYTFKVIHILMRTTLFLKRLAITGILVIVSGFVAVYGIKMRSDGVRSSASTVSREYTSHRLGVRFTYISQDLGKKIIVEEEGTKIFVHYEHDRSELGQYVQVFQKSPQMSLAQAVQEQFLSTQQNTVCTVKSGIDSSGTQPTSGVAAIISFPIGHDANTDGLELGKNCPEGYSISNGLSYFWTTHEQSPKYVFFSIGQYTIPSSAQGGSWHTTLKFLES
jgi:hypothetical protein